MLQSNNNKAPGSQNTILLKCLVLRFHEPWHNNKVCVIYFSILTTETQPWMPEWCISFNKNVTFRFKALRLPEYSRYGFHPWMDNLRLPDALLVTPPLSGLSRSFPHFTLNVIARARCPGSFPPYTYASLRSKSCLFCIIYATSSTKSYFLVTFHYFCKKRYILCYARGLVA